MRIKFLTSIAGSNYSHKPGDEVEWRDNAEAERFIKAGYATKIGPSDQAPRIPPVPPKEEKAKIQQPVKPSVEKSDGKDGSEKATLKR